MNEEVPPPDDQTVLPPWATDSKARDEERNWDDEDKLKGQKAENDLKALKVYGLIVPTMMVSFALFYISALFVWSAHYMTPWCWLSADQLSKVQSTIFSGSIGAFVASVAAKHFSSK